MIEHFYKDIEGWFDYEEVFQQMVQEFDSGAHFVEIGAYLGKSTAYMAVEIANSNKNIRFDVVDTWRGSPEHQEGGVVYTESMVNDTAFAIFTENLKPAAAYYNPMKSDSVGAAKLYADNSLDFVFIDATHEYESVLADIAAWRSKVKIGGYLCGHDYDPPHWPGVVRAVDEMFPDDFTVTGISWIHKVKQ